jgi:hypothetical protein
MAKAKTKAPLETKQEEMFWADAIRRRVSLTLHLEGREAVQGRPLFATGEMIGLALPGGFTRLVEREEVLYLEVPPQAASPTEAPASAVTANNE